MFDRIKYAFNLQLPGSNGKFPLATSPLLRSAFHYAFNIDTISNYGCMGWGKPDSTFTRLPPGECRM